VKTHKTQLEHAASATKPVLSGFLVGSVIGAATALLFAPRSGEETRTEIRDKAIELRDQATETVKSTVEDVRDNVREKVEGLKQRGKYTVNRQLDRVSEAAETGKEKIQEY
jgi:gas vesicle protein